MRATRLARTSAADPGVSPSSQRTPSAIHSRSGAAWDEGYRALFVLFWSPGPSDHPQHPGDDEKAVAVLQGTRGLPVLEWPTRDLRSLVAGLAACDGVVCSDGGAMHVAAALGKPIVCFFGDSDATCWRPWGVPHRLLQRASREVTEITVEEAVAAYGDLAEAAAGAPADSG